MQFKLVLLGAILLTLGLLAYSWIPNVRRIPIITTQAVPGPESLQVPSESSVENVRNVTAAQGRDNLLLANITVTTQSGSLSSLRFKLFAGNSTQFCDSTNARFLANEDVSNNSLSIPITKSGAYCFVFDNLVSSTPKIVRTAASIQSGFMEVQVTNDGGMNIAGLGLGAFGFIIALVGFSRRTVIPWE